MAEGAWACLKDSTDLPRMTRVEVTSSCTNTGIESFLPLINCFVYYTQLEASRGVYHLLPHICHVLY